MRTVDDVLAVAGLTRPADRLRIAARLLDGLVETPHDWLERLVGYCDE